MLGNGEIRRDLDIYPPTKIGIALFARSTRNDGNTPITIVNAADTAITIRDPRSTDTEPSWEGSERYMLTTIRK